MAYAHRLLLVAVLILTIPRAIAPVKATDYQTATTGWFSLSPYLSAGNAVGLAQVTVRAYTDANNNHLYSYKIDLILRYVDVKLGLSVLMPVCAGGLVAYGVLSFTVKDPNKLVSFTTDDFKNFASCVKNGQLVIIRIKTDRVYYPIAAGTGWAVGPPNGYPNE